MAVMAKRAVGRAVPPAGQKMRQKIRAAPQSLAKTTTNAATPMMITTNATI
jgi:hypothetical protein